MIIEWNKNHHFEGIPDAEISVGEGDFFTDQLWLRDLLPYKIKWFKEIAEKHFGLFKEEILQIEKDKKRIAQTVFEHGRTMKQAEEIKQFFNAFYDLPNRERCAESGIKFCKWYLEL